MSQAAVIINVSDQDQMHSNGLSGTFLVPGKKLGEEFGALVIFPTPEVQDIGDNRTTVHWLKAAPIAKDVVGLRSDAASHGFGSSGTKEKWGLLLCEAEPDLPKELLNAIEAEINYLNVHMPDVKFRKDQPTGAIVAINVEDPDVRAEKIRLSSEVEMLRSEFVKECKKLVSKAEVRRAKEALQREDQRLVAEGDRMWQRPTEQVNINELHRRACIRLGQERPWCYVPLQLVDCPGCGQKIKENVITCPSCGAFLEEGIGNLMKMTPKERAVKMYPNRYAEAART
jgi:hypothetical protein